MISWADICKFMLYFIHMCYIYANIHLLINTDQRKDVLL